MSQRSEITTIGILYCGDLGAALARLLHRVGARVVTTCEGRSPQTHARAQSAAIEILPTLDAVTSVADVVVSLVLPNAAEEVARQYASRKSLGPADSLFVDANSIDLHTLAGIEATLTDANIRFVDAAIHGGAKTLEHHGVMYFSGCDANDALAVCAPAMQTKMLGETVGQATRMKLLLASLSKSLNALFLEVAVLSHNTGMLDEFVNQAKHFYPEIMNAIERMLPTYPQHVQRRILELKSIEDLARSVSSPHDMMQAGRCLLQTVANSWANELEVTSEIDVARIVALAAGATTQNGASE